MNGVMFRDSENLEIPERINFSIWPKDVGPQVSSNIIKPIRYFKLLCLINVFHGSIVR